MADIRTIMPAHLNLSINMNRGFASKSNLPDMMDALPSGMSKSEAPKVDLGRTQDNSLQNQSMETLRDRAKPKGTFSGGSTRMRMSTNNSY